MDCGLHLLRGVGYDEEYELDLWEEWDEDDAPSRPLRFLPAGRWLVEVTTRTVHGRFLLLPRPEANAIIRGVLGRASHLYPEVKIVGYWFLSNHWEALLVVPSSAALTAFMNHVNSNLARQLGALYKWPERFWGRRYRAIVVIGERAEVRRLKYLLAQGTKENLVSRPAEWTGVSSLRATLEGINDVGTWFDARAEYQSRKQRMKRGRKPLPKKDFITEYEIPVVPLPCWERLAPQERRRRARKVVKEIEDAAAEARTRTKKKARGMRFVLAQAPHDHPKKIARSPAPFVHASSKAERKRFKDHYDRFVRRFRKAATRFFEGDASALKDFPRGCFIPRPPSGLRFRRLRRAA